MKRIVIGADVLRYRPVTSNGLIEHPAERDTIDHSGMEEKDDEILRLILLARTANLQELCATSNSP